jgi:UDP-glucose 6-dehydrogenase
LGFYDGNREWPESQVGNQLTQSTGVENNRIGIPMHSVSNVEMAELTKIVENADRYLQIAFAEELYLYCQANHVNFSELKDALNTKWNVHILEPRDGIGGHCVPKDTKMFLDSSKSIKSKILLAALEADQDYRKFREMRDKQFKSSDPLKDRQILPS